MLTGSPRCSSFQVSDQRIEQEWQELIQSPSTKSCNAELYYNVALQNPSKNRYPDVLPFESTRVRLNSGDYINANYISLSPNARYICAQAPLPNTFTEFWQMVWEHKTPVIVMLTKLLERRRIKGHCYWPSEVNEVESFGDLSVRLVSTSQEPNIQIRQFVMTCNGQEHSVCHIHYTEWPDFGVPRTTDTIRRVLEIMEQTRASCAGSELPFAIVHCSAGIGRAGTFLAILGFIEKLKEKVPTSSILIKEIVDCIRQQRMSMVQTKEQYGFIYKVVDDIVVHSGHPLGSSGTSLSSYTIIKDKRAMLVQSHDQFPVRCEIY